MKTLALTALLMATGVQANTKIDTDLGSLEIKNVASVAQATPTTTRLQQIGGVIQTSRDAVALGESIYNLVEKGRPKITTEYAPISVVPRDPLSNATDPALRNAVDPFDMEGFSFPVEKMITAKFKSPILGLEVVEFKYKVIYSYGGSYNGAGRYLTGINIIPASVKVKHGWTLSSSMKLTGIMNHGTKADPVAGAMITIKYTMSSGRRAIERNDTIYFSGDGKMKAMIAN